MLKACFVKEEVLVGGKIAAVIEIANKTTSNWFLYFSFMLTSTSSSINQITL